jgi:hypothetical protein
MLPIFFIHLSPAHLDERRCQLDLCMAGSIPKAGAPLLCPRRPYLQGRAGRINRYTRPHSKNVEIGNCLFLEF